jgi:hypothetical protein
MSHSDEQPTIVAPLPSPGKLTVILDDLKRGGHVFVETTPEGLEELLAAARAGGQMHGTIPVVNDRGEVLEVEIARC